MQNNGQVICEFKFLCDKKWEDLLEIRGEKNTRYCNACEKPVFYCYSYEDLAYNVESGRCIAISSVHVSSVHRETPELLLGKV